MTAGEGEGPRERPIIFTGPNLLTIMAGRKTQTRRILLRQPREWKARVIDISKPLQDEEGVWGQVRTEWSSPSFDMPYGEPEREIWEPLKLPCYVGDRLWVREAWCPIANEDGSAPPRTTAGCHYRADGTHVTLDDGDGFTAVNADGSERSPWRSPIHMPRWASRLTLTVTDVRVERLQEISEEDARAEGHPMTWDGKCYEAPPPEVDSWQGYGRASFSLTWSEIHGPGAWEANPWVAAITFALSTRPSEQPIRDGGERP